MFTTKVQVKRVELVPAAKPQKSSVSGQEQFSQNNYQQWTSQPDDPQNHVFWGPHCFV